HGRQMVAGMEPLRAPTHRHTPTPATAVQNRETPLPHAQAIWRVSPRLYGLRLAERGEIDALRCQIGEILEKMALSILTSDVRSGDDRIRTADANCEKDVPALAGKRKRGQTWV